MQYNAIIRGSSTFKRKFVIFLPIRQTFNWVEEISKSMLSRAKLSVSVPNYLSLQIMRFSREKKKQNKKPHTQNMKALVSSE